MDDLTNDVLTLQCIEFVLSYSLLIILPTLARTNWARVWRETRMDLELLYWNKIRTKWTAGRI